MTYHIAKWEEYQHYRDRCPPWIKLHYSLLTSPTWVMLDDAGRVLAIACMLIASRNGGDVPGDPEYMRRVAYLNNPPNFAPLLECGFLTTVPNASAVLADASALKADDTTETETEKETEKSKGKKRTPARTPSRTPVTVAEIAIPFGSEEFKEAWENWATHRAEIKHKLTPTATKQQLQALEDMGEGRAIAAIKYSIAGGWQGIFEPKHNPRQPNLDDITIPGEFG